MCNHFFLAKRLGLYSKKSAPGRVEQKIHLRRGSIVGVFYSVQSIVWPYFFVFALFLSLM